jgi:hypothetical protein
MRTMRIPPAKDRSMNFRSRLVATAMLAAAAFLIPHPAQAADPVKVEKMLIVLKVDRQMDKMKELMAQGIEGGFVSAARKRGMTQEQIDRGKPILERMTKSVTDMFSWEYMKPQVVRIYEEELTDQEVDSAIAYYTSPQGQSLLAKMPTLMQRGAEVGMKRAQEMSPKVEAEIDAALNELRDQESKDARKTADAAMKQVHDAEAKDATAKDPPAASDKTSKDAAPQVAKPETTPDKPAPQH